MALSQKSCGLGRPRPLRHAVGHAVGRPAQRSSAREAHPHWLVRIPRQWAGLFSASVGGQRGHTARVQQPRHGWVQRMAARRSQELLLRDEGHPLHVELRSRLESPPRPLGPRQRCARTAGCAALLSHATMAQGPSQTDLAQRALLGASPPWSWQRGAGRSAPDSRGPPPP